MSDFLMWALVIVFCLGWAICAAGPVIVMAIMMDAVCSSGSIILGAHKAVSDAKREAGR